MDITLDNKHSLAKASRGQLELGILLAGLGLGTVDYLADTITLDALAASFFDVEPDKPISRGEIHSRIHKDDWGGVCTNVENLLKPQTKDVIELKHRVVHQDGSIVWVNARKLITFGLVDGKEVPISGLIAIQDITELKSNEGRVNLLLGEVNHRAKNLLTVVQSIARMTARRGDMATFVDRFSDRLASLSANQDLIVENLWTDVVLEKLVFAHLNPFMEKAAGRVEVEGVAMKVPANVAQAIGMALHELATNALKYGALSNDVGKVNIRWRKFKDKFMIEWVESGGPEVVPPTETGFGERVINQMAAQSLHGDVSLTYNPEGVKWVLEAPLEEVLT